MTPHRQGTGREGLPDLPVNTVHVSEKVYRHTLALLAQLDMVPRGHEPVCVYLAAEGAAVWVDIIDCRIRDISDCQHL